MKYSVITFGCRVNQADSLGFEEEFLRRGAQPADPDHADIVVVNTCSVTASADQGARQIIRRIARQNPSAEIVVTGCYATRRPDEIATLPNVSHIVPNGAKPRLLPLIERTEWAAARRPGIGVDSAGPESLTTADRFSDGDGSCGAAIEPGVAGRTAFTLRVQTGCDAPCSYCIIPSTRGAPMSVPIERVLDEVQRIIGAGFKEIVLTGVHLGSYGRDLCPQSSFVELLGRLSAATLTLSETPLFRISSLEPMDCTPAVVDLVAESPVFAPHFHLPLQHASDRMLRMMRRPYTLDDYRGLVDSICARLPSAAIGSDVIVGFPGETDADFDALVDYLESAPLTHVHVFPYSDRPGTDASSLGGKVHGSIVRERARIIRDVAHRLTTRFRAAQHGTVHRGLTLEDGSLVVTGNYLKVRVPPVFARNQWVDIRITATEEPLRGDFLTPSA